jgi:hypothetical protein
MHTLGKVLAWFTFLLALGAVYLSAQVLAKRNAATAQLETNRAAYEKTIAPLEEARVALRRAKDAYKQALHGWTPLYGGNLPIVPGNPGEIAIRNLGQTSRLQAGKRVHVFTAGADGKSAYLGPFTVTEVFADQTNAVADFPLRPSDQANWQNLVGQSAGRVYGSIPSVGPETVLHLQQLMVRKQQLLEAEQELLAVRQKEVNIANEHLNYRNNELHGDQTLQNDRDALPQFVIDGLVKAIEDADESRNRIQTEVDDLRHQIKASYDEIVALKAANEALAATLPAGEATAGPAPSSVGE